MKLPKFYHKKKDRWSIIRGCFSGYFLFFTAPIMLSVIFLVVIKSDDIKIPQKEIVVKIDIKNKINICLPDEQNK